MSNIHVTPDSELIRVLADDVNHACTDGMKIQEANEIIRQLAEDPNPQNLHEIAQTIAYTLTDLQQKSLNFLSTVADQKTIGYGDKAAFKVKNSKGIRAVIQAKGSTTPRSFAGEREVLVGTEEISARPAIPIMDLRTGRVNMADLIREANHQFDLIKLAKVESVLQDAIDAYSSPFYGESATVGVINQQVLNNQLNYFRRIGPVSILGDISAVNLLTPLQGMAMNSTLNMYSGNAIDEFHRSGFIGNYNGCAVSVLENAYDVGKTDPILKTNWLYLLPGGMSAESKNLKIVNEGPVNAFSAQDINDMIYEVRLDQWFGAAFVTAHEPTMGAHKIATA